VLRALLALMQASSSASHARVPSTTASPSHHHQQRHRDMARQEPDYRATGVAATPSDSDLQERRRLLKQQLRLIEGKRARVTALLERKAHATLRGDPPGMTAGTSSACSAVSSASTHEPHSTSSAPQSNKAASVHARSQSMRKTCSGSKIRGPSVQQRQVGRQLPIAKPFAQGSVIMRLRERELMKALMTFDPAI